MKQIVVFAFLLIAVLSTAALAGSTPAMNGRLVNETLIPNDRLELTAVFSKLIPCNPKVDGEFCKAKKGPETGRTSCAIKADGTFHLPKGKFSSGKAFFDLYIRDTATTQQWHYGHLKVTDETWENSVRTIALFQWREESLTFASPTGGTISDYVKDAIRKSPHLDPTINYIWRIQVTSSYLYFGKTVYGSRFGLKSACPEETAITQCIATSEAGGDSISSTLFSTVDALGSPIIEFWPHTEKTLPDIHSTQLDGTIDLLVIHPETGKIAGWATITKPTNSFDNLKHYSFRGTPGEIFTHRTLEFQDTEKLRWVEYFEK